MIEIAPRSLNDMSFEEALLYCIFCDHAGHKDWRLPTSKEYRGYAIIFSWYDDYSHINFGFSKGFRRYVTPVRTI